MAIPAQGEFYRPVLDIVANTPGGATRQQLIERAALELDVDADDRRETFGGSQTSNKFDYRVTSAAHKLNDAGLVHRPQRGLYVITDTGRDLLSQHSGSITRKQLGELQRTSNRGETFPGRVFPNDDPISEFDDVSPVELMAQTHHEVERTLMGDLQAGLISVSPDRFERLVLDLLNKMAYGEPVHTGKTGDGGIDGIVNQDALGLEKVYVQAKRYSSGSVGEPEIRNFAGSMIASGATKGVFITTSNFRATARQTAANVSQRNETIRLVDGDELARLMITHGVGVVTEYTYEIKKLDENYFAEEI